MDVHSSKQLDQMNVSGLSKARSSFKTHPQLSFHMVQKDWKMWRINGQAQKGGQNTLLQMSLRASNALRFVGTHQLLPVWWFDPQLIRQLVEFYFLVDFFAATWGVLVTVNKDLEH